MESEPKKIKIRRYSMDFVLKNSTLHAQLRKLTLCSFSGMNRELNNFEKIIHKRKVNAKALVASLEEVPIAWALLSKEASDFKFINGTEYNAGHGVLFEVYVDQAHRRKGIASRLLKIAKRISAGQKICIAPHDYKSRLFYEKNKRDLNLNCKEL